MNVILKILKKRKNPKKFDLILRAKIVWNLKISAFQVSGSILIHKIHIHFWW